MELYKCINSKLYKDEKLKEYKDIRSMKAEIANDLSALEYVGSVKFSGSPEAI